MENKNEYYMNKAVQEAYDGIKNLHGGPFGSVIVRNDEIIGTGHNRVIIDKDPTAHGEIVAIRNTCKNINSIDLSDCVLYTTAEPCPMCLCAIMWAGIKEVYFGCSKFDTADIGFSDDKFYNNIITEKYTSMLDQVGKEKCLELFQDYIKLDNRTHY